MQCPSCGFENMPGTERCCACAALLTGRVSDERVYPPRARDNSLLHRMGETLSRPWRWACQRNWSAFRLVLLSIIPGLGHGIVLGKGRVGWVLLGVAVVALALSVILYRSSLSTLLLYGVVALSILSVTVAADKVYGSVFGRAAATWRRVGISLLVVSAFLAGYFVLRLCLLPAVMTMRVTAQPLDGALAQGDTLLVYRLADVDRGAVTAGTGHPGRGTVPVVGPVIGMPGDRIYLKDRVYLNGEPTRFSLRLPEPGSGYSPTEASVTLEEDEYWIMPFYRGVVVNARYLAEAGTVKRGDVWGRAIAVLGPPGHRRLLGPVSVMDEGEGDDTG